MKPEKFWACGALLLALNGCVTAEWQAVQSDCTKTQYRLLPPSFQMVSVLRPVPFEVPTGQTVCTSTSSGATVTTDCRQVTMTQWRQLPDYERVDVNAEARLEAINHCIKTTCLTQYGNLHCRPPTPRPPSPAGATPVPPRSANPA
jgi:hypothetical protein